MSKQAASYLSRLALLTPLLLSACAGAMGRVPTPTFIPRDFTPGAPTRAEPGLAPGENTFYVAPDGLDSNPGTLEQPWATINHAAEMLREGESVLVRGGRYALERQVRPKQSGSAQGWITYAGFPGETVVLDASGIARLPPAGSPPYPHDNGAFQLEQVSYIRVQDLAIERSYAAGFTIRDSHHIELLNNRTHLTFSSGIAAWDTNHDGQGTHDIRVIGNTITKATTWEMLPPGQARSGEPPHEAISIAGAIDFEVAYNHIYNSDKEGIDVKETSRRGTVHHNLIHDLDRQGLYVDAWFGRIEDIELYENVVYNCRGAGIAISVENGELVENVRIHHNLIFENLGTGIFFSRWGDGPRKNIQVYNNTVHRNGYGPPNPPDPYFWMTGGLYLYSANLQDITIRDNIFSDNNGFQIGYSSHYLAEGGDAEAVLRQKGIRIENNLIHQTRPVDYPIRVGWPPNDYADVYAYSGSLPIFGDPSFMEIALQDYRLKPGSPALLGGNRYVGVYPPDSSPAFWWKESVLTPVRP